MSAQTGYLEVDALGVLPKFSLLLVIFLTLIGAVAHVALA